MFVSYNLHCKKNKSPRLLVKLNITFYFRSYLHHNCSINLKWNNTQLYSSAKPLRYVPSPVFWFINFCSLPFLHRISIQKWKEIWFCYAHKWIGKQCFIQAVLLLSVFERRLSFWISYFMKNDHKIILQWK